MPLLQKVKNQMKGRQMRHFIRVGTACANVKSPMNMQGRICIWTKRVNIVLIISLVRSLPVVHNSKKKKKKIDDSTLTETKWKGFFYLVAL